MSKIIGVLWQSAIGQVTLVSLAYSLFGVLLVGGYLSYFAGGFSVIADLSLQDILFFVPSFVAGFTELVWREGARWLKKVFQWVFIYVISPLAAGLLLVVLLQYLGVKRVENETLFSLGFVSWLAGLEGVIWPSRRKVKVLCWLWMVGSVMLLSFFVPQSSNSSGEVALISPVIGREVFTWSVIIEFLLLPMIIGREIARILFEQGKLLKIEECNTKKVLNSCSEEMFLVALLHKWVIMYAPSTLIKKQPSSGAEQEPSTIDASPTSARGKLLLFPSEEAISIVLRSEMAKEKSA